MNTSTKPIRMLVVEDHVGLAENLSEYFENSHYVLDFASDGLTALHLIATHEYDVIVLDVMLPGLSGFDICHRIRNDIQCTTPVIMMTAKDQLKDKEEGFRAGADDYLVKPFDLRELQLRVNALYRRKECMGKTPGIEVPGIRFDPGKLTVQVNHSGSLELSGTMARIFEELIKAYPGFLSYEQLQERIWGEKEVDMNTLRTHVYTLRKLLQDTFGFSMIKTMHGRGYRLTPPAQAEQ
ncbi:MAG: response regulator transcription factor [Advenella sp.]|uniref:response regulator transcription factor n=1 Tax=Advenella sp. TaxID=1872388 RepID=UPI002585145D|nr:response regulator transcription factor [Advenella sp.]MDD3757484.1 response regulator transcription factor [Advenella sp.]